MFKSLLIANRGEIACRVIRTARRLGIRTIAVYSAADAGALHVEMADEAWPIGPAPARESYLSVERIIDAARRSGTEAVHPGYGFLSENAAFAEACSEAGIVFVGPPVEAIRAMGSKSAAKSLMERSGVPLVPGYHGAAQDLATLAAEADRIGYPVLIKASAGGGGKGMRVVEHAAGFEAALASAKREAMSSFGDDHVLIEKYLTRPRHIEIQVFADTHGNLVSLFERDCSIQRRHQKVIEEAPAPGMDPARRAEMGEAACAAARAVNYVGAGTVEFIAEGDAFYFMEMNTRLQVEHPVTEAITRQDLVEWQLVVAAGGRLPKRQDELTITGHAIEVRIYAEEPARDFAPSTGHLDHMKLARAGRHVRIDAGVRQGDTIGIHYDPMIAKLIVWDRDRPSAVRRLGQALAACEIGGVRTNLAFLGAIAAHPAYQAAELDTGFIPRHAAELFPPPVPADRVTLAAAALRVLADEHLVTELRAQASGDPWSPWNSADAWRLNGDGFVDLGFRDGETTVAVRVTITRDGTVTGDFPDGSAAIAGRKGAVSIDGVRRRVSVARLGDEITVTRDGLRHRLEFVDPLATSVEAAVSGGRLVAPMPGRITQVLVAPGAVVTRGAPLMVLEAMKMEHTISASADGKVDTVRYRVGDIVEEGAELVSITAAGA